VGDHLHVNAHQSELNVRVCGGSALLALDMLACRCGYLTCSKTGPCAPPPKDVLPEGWKRLEGYPERNTFQHVSGCHVWGTGGDMWFWCATGEKKARDILRGTRDEAMAAAMEAARPPEYRACMSCGSVTSQKAGDLCLDAYECELRVEARARRAEREKPVAHVEAGKPSRGVAVNDCGELVPAEPQGVDYRFPVTAEPELRPGWRKTLAGWRHDARELAMAAALEAARRGDVGSR
jgi:hypothetical protein